jgi:thiol-disulfide isomerase/thioredoxin
MTLRSFGMLTGMILYGVLVLPIGAAESPSPSPAVPAKPSTIQEVYPGLASKCLTYARLADLPAGVVLKAEGLTITAKEIAGEIAKAPQETQPQLKKNAFFVLENLATRKLLVGLAKAKMPAMRTDAASIAERDLLDGYFKDVAAKVDVSEKEVADFYENNKDMCGGATLDQMKDSLKQYVLQQKQQEAVDEHIRTLGRRVPVEVSSAWTKEQSVLAKDNPVDKARASGKPSLVDFGSTGCKPCDMLAPILETLKEKYAGKVNVVFVHCGQEQILASRYGISSIPMQFFYDKDGKEVFRHVGFIPQQDIEKKLAEMGVQ